MYSPGQQIEEPSRVSPDSHVNHVRTNFVGRGYQPPATATAGQYSPPRTLPAGKDVHVQAWRPQTHTSTQRLQAPMIVEDEVDMDSEMPFDQERDQSPSTTSGRQVDQPTPRLFNPMCPAMNAYHQPEQEQSRVATVATRFEQHYSSPARRRVDRFDEFGSSPNSSPQRTATAANHRANRLSYNQPPSQPGDDDSLFDFQEGQDPVRKLSKAKNHHQSSKQRRTLIVGAVPEDEEEQVVHDDEDSIEELPYGARAAPSPVNLQERTQQAWKVRKGKTSVLRTKSKSPTNDRAQMGVSFGKSDTVHHFEPEEQELTNDDETATLGSFEDRSLNSMYTKSMESEVEDVLKDVLLIGTESHSRPGRRKVKHKYEVKKKLRQQANKTGTLSRSCQGETVPEDDDEETFEIAAEEEKAPQEDVAAVASYRVNRSTKQKSTSKNESSSKKTLAKEMSSNKQKPAHKSSSLEAEKRRKAAERRKKAENDDPFVIMWGYLDSGIKAVSEALGMEEEEAEKPKRKSKKNSIVAKKSTDRQAEPAAQVSSAKDELRVVEAPDDELQFSDKLASRKSEEESAEDTVNYQQEMLYDSNGRSRSASLDEEQDLQNDFTQSYSASMDGEQEVQAEEKAGEEVQIGESVFDPTAVEEDDPRIVELAIYAAKSLHTSRDVQYDDSIPIDMFEDIQLSVVELKLPLGCTCTSFSLPLIWNSIGPFLYNLCLSLREQ